MTIYRMVWSNTNIHFFYLKLCNKVSLAHDWVLGCCEISFTKSSRVWVLMEVIGLMLGEFVDEYIIFVLDVVPMPQSASNWILDDMVLSSM